ncbi:hypothetical protein PVAND_010902 [Polypedilum vanderplanki]|uniref:DM10 domain-containing protein n=1 Tax=Polypedilum vanderplanki TaxID=319348 RepID=A0A9J6CIS6_POLVA|nr:hypothetical protein PVAND_010902 [Polypedilum vanderplanki]
MNCHRLPTLPGLSFEERLKRNHHVPHSFFYSNGYRMNRTPTVTIGKEPLQQTYKDFYSEPVEFDPALTYGRTKKQQVEAFRPHYVIYDKRTLKFMGYFRQHVPESRVEHYRIRYVNIFYYLEDDTIEVIEPLVKNCGLFPQGRLLRRGKITKDASTGTFYTWKDFNIGIDIELGGIVYHICDSDTYSKEFLTANGVEVNERECMPKDQASIDKIIQQTQHKHHHQKTPKDDKLRRFLEYFGMVLSFDCISKDEAERAGDELIKFKLFYYLEDDTVAIKELGNHQGCDGFPMLLKRTKLPKNWNKKSPDFASIVFETTESDMARGGEYYQVKDFVVGQTIMVFGKKFLLMDCDKFTREYYDKVLRFPQPNKLEIEKPIQPEIKIKLPTYLGIGTPEDSLASTFYLRPKPPKKDVVTYLLNAHKVLRYGVRLDSVHPEDKDRKFIMNYNLADGQMSIMEQSEINSGIIGGKFLSSRKIVKPDSDPNRPQYYTPKDFAIGARIHIFAHRFIITSADLYSYRYMLAHPELFSPEIIEGVRIYNLKEGNLSEDVRKSLEEDQQRFFNESMKKNYNEEEKLEQFDEEGVSSKPISNERIPKPFITEDEVKKYYHDKEEVQPSYMNEKTTVPCNINIKEEEKIPSDTRVVRFLEPYEN